MKRAELVGHRLSNYRRVLAEKRLDALLLTNFWAETPQGGDYNILYLSNLEKRFIFSFLILTPDRCGVWVEADDLPRAREQSWLNVIEAMPAGEQWGYSGSEFARIAGGFVREWVSRDRIRVGYDGRYMPSSVALGLLDFGFQLEEIALDLEKSKLVKDELELENMRRAGAIADQAVVRVMEMAREGVREIDLAAWAEAVMRSNDAECFWWKTLLASGPEAEKWFDSPTERQVQKGDLVVMDFTPVHHGYGGDIARAFVVGVPTPEQRQVWDLARQVLDASVCTLKEGVTLRQLMNEGVRVVEGSRYRDFYVGTGHGVGLYSHVYPIFLSSIARMKTIPAAVLDTRLMAGMTVAMEVIFTVPGLGGVRLEDSCVVGRDASERLNQSPMVPSV